MRTKLNLRAPKALHVAAGALILAVPGTAVALESGVAQALGATSGPALHTSVTRSTLGYGRYESVNGSAPRSDAGRPVELQFLPSGARTWRSVAHGTIRSTGRFGFRVRLTRSGSLRAVSPATKPGSIGVVGASSPPSPSNPQHVGVAAALLVPRHRRVVEAGHRVSVRGSLLPRRGGVTVRLMTHTRGGWRTLIRTRTGSHGGFDLRYAMRSTGTRWLTVSFAGDRSNRSAWAHAGSVTGMVPQVASWYNDGGSTACGYHAGYGVANRTLPCGTKVRFEYHGRSVVATVDDRGPYVAGRNYDLNQNTAGALGMYGVATVLASR